VQERIEREVQRFADTLAQMLAEKKMTQAELAQRIGVGQSAISMMLSRKCRPQPRTLGKLAEALGVSVETLWPVKVGFLGLEKLHEPKTLSDPQESQERRRFGDHAHILTLAALG
jgi:transcriptional regulator with XRE-family HTH domain